MAKFEVGQQVWARHAAKFYLAQNRGSVPGVVTRVGYKYIYVQLSNSFSETKFTAKEPHIQVYDNGVAADYYLHRSEEAISAYWQNLDTVNRIKKTVEDLKRNFPAVPDERSAAFDTKLRRAEKILASLNEEVKKE